MYFIFAAFLYLTLQLVKPSHVGLKCALSSLQDKRVCFFVQNETCKLSTSNITSPNNYGSKTFMKQSVNITLFRVVSGSGVQAYNYFMTSTNFSSSIIDKQRNFSANFKSILLQEWNNVKPSMMNVTLRDNQDAVVAWLLFQVTSGDNLESWFTKGQLIGSFPWNLTSLLSLNYNYFSLLGNYVIPPYHRSFHFMLSIGTCDEDIGGLAVYEYLPEACPYVIATRIPTISYVVNIDKPDYYSKFIRYAKAMEIIEIYDQSVDLFIET